MKTRFFLLNLLISAFIISSLLYSQSDSTSTQIEYICPMNCSDNKFIEPGRCPICGMDLRPREISEHLLEEKLINSEELKKLLESEEEFLLLDVRTEQEFNGDVKPLDGAVLIPISELKNKIGELEEFKEQKIIVYCLRGIRSELGAKILNENGFDAYNLEGGLIVWYEEIN